MSDSRRQLPSVDRILQEASEHPRLRTAPRPHLVREIRALLSDLRARRSPFPEDWADTVADRMETERRPSLHAVINATGVVLHTNLGRAPLAEEAVAALVEVARSYSTLEYDVATGTRGSRHDHAAPVLARLTGGEEALIVNNAAGALVLALNEVAAGREVIISRGELIEIGGAFRIPDILERSGARLREVGTTNRTHLEDYAQAIGPDTGALLIVHRSNFAQTGFTATPSPTDLAALGRAHGFPVLYDVGSGLLADLTEFGIRDEPRIQDAIRTGVDLVLFSGDKLLGGPQAGCLAGRRDLIRNARRNPLARALRADKFTLAALEATLALYRDPDTALSRVPVLRMLTRSPASLRAAALHLRDLTPPEFHPILTEGTSAVGGGALPDQDLPTTLLSLDPGPLGADGLALRLRLGDPCLVTRVGSGRVLLDPRTLDETDPALVARALLTASQS